MSYQKKMVKNGVNIHIIQTDKFKTNLLACFITVPLERESVTFDAMIPAVLRRGSKNMRSQEEISINLEEMYGAEFNCGIEKTGDNHIMKFYLEFLNDNFLPNNENVFESSLNTFFEIIFDPLIENDGFNNEYLLQEKDTLKQIIEAKINNKARYAYLRCIEEMYKDKPYGLYNYGYVEDLEKISSKGLYEYYNEVIKKAKIDIFISGDFENINELINCLENNEYVKNLNERDYVIAKDNEKYEKENVNKIEEKMEVGQGNLIIGMDILENKKETKYIALVYNAILGGTPTSKMFQNVREKESLAYSANSNYLKSKANIIVKCGIEIENYEKALNIINKQVDDMKMGNFNDEDLRNAKKSIISNIRLIEEEQDTQITYYLGLEIADNNSTPQDYIQNVEKVTKEDIIELAGNVKLNTIYFLRN